MSASAGSTPSASSTTTIGPPSSLTSNTAIPRVGAIRCYWSLLKPYYPSPHIPDDKLDLLFVYPDPVLGTHLARQKMNFLGRGVMEFIHPAERKQARNDLTKAIKADDLHGSVTRVRFARLSRVRTILGGVKEELEIPDDADVVSEDDDYLILDLTLNWVADGLLLAFFHAVKDKDPIRNNDYALRDEEWTNWCGTANMPEEQIQIMADSIAASITPPPRTHNPPIRIFQLHTTKDSPTRPDELLYSWPPPRLPGPRTLYDGLYDAAEYPNLMKMVTMDPNLLVTDTVKTSCTTRFAGIHAVKTENIYRIISSVFVPYGSLIFACYQTTKVVEPHTPNRQMVPTMPQQPAIDSYSSADTRMSDGYSGDWYYNSESEHTGSKESWNVAAPSDDSWEQLNASDPHARQDHDTHNGQPLHEDKNQDDYPQSRFSLPPLLPQSEPPRHWHHQPLQTQEHPETHMYQRQPLYNHEQQHQYELESLSHVQPHPHSHSRPPSAHPHYARHTPYPIPVNVQSLQNSMPAPLHSPLGLSPISPTHPAHYAPHLQTSASSSSSNGAHGTSPLGQHSFSEDLSPDKSPIGVNGSGTTSMSSSSRPLVPPPGDVECCVICGTRESPEWRRNESGVKDLCNACGLRLARQVAKREGRQKPRKKQSSGNLGR